MINKSFDILEVFLHHPGEVGLIELAGLSHNTASTTHRIASTLVKRGYLRQPQKRGKYSLGFKFLEFEDVRKGTLTVRNVARPFLQKLQEEVGESVNLAILDSDKALYVENLASSHTLRTFTRLGNRVPLICTGVGKVFLAHMSEEQARPLVKPKTLSTLRPELKAIRETGFAIDNEEMEAGVRCVAFPVKDSTGNVAAAVSVSAPSIRLDARIMEDIKPKVKRCASRISRALGFDGA